MEDFYGKKIREIEKKIFEIFSENFEIFFWNIFMLEKISPLEFFVKIFFSQGGPL